MDIVVVIDILRATSAMVTAFAHGVERIIPVSTVEKRRSSSDAPGTSWRPNVMALWWKDQCGNSPLAFQGPEVAGRPW
ncbi:MAG: 2-phosphosulfolactate phosphatase [Flavobacteriales bacterium]|nr:2-phosphosulfolactate phosphatase [Flavobacteriales bacterium]